MKFNKLVLAMYRYNDTKKNASRKNGQEKTLVANTSEDYNELEKERIIPYYSIVSLLLMHLDSFIFQFVVVLKSKVFS